MHRLCSPRRNQALQCLFFLKGFFKVLFKDPLTLLSPAEPSSSMFFF